MLGDPPMMRVDSRVQRPAALCALALLLTVSAGCATLAPRQRATLAPVTVSDSKALHSAAEAFYSARSAAELKAALDHAKALAPTAGLTHELAAELARLEMREPEEFDARIAAAQDLSYDATLFQLQRLELLTRDDARQARYVGLLEALSTEHPDPRVRSAASYYLAAHLHLYGDDEGRDVAVRGVDAVLPLSVVGGWDNDQGKGFDLAHPPELGVDLTATYEGSLMQIGWQTPPRDFRGETDLREFVSPGQWSVAYAASGLSVPQEGTYELRVATTDPIKVFVDGALVFEARELQSVYGFDQFVIPVKLAAGEHQVLIKSAHRTGDWRLFARVTGEKGAQVAVTPTAAGAVKSVTRIEKVLGGEHAAASVVLDLAEGDARRGFFAALRAELSLGGTAALRASQEFARRHPDSVLARYELVGALWNNGERGRTADDLTLLDKTLGADLPLIRKQQARFWQQEGLRSRARKTLIDLVTAYPERAPPARQLANLFDAEKWNEDQCRTLEKLEAAQPNTLNTQLAVAECWDEEHREDRAIKLYQQALKTYPRHITVLHRLQDALRTRGKLKESAEIARGLIAAYPEKLWPRLQLAETLRRSGKMEEAHQVLADAQQAFPNSADVYRAQATLAWREGNEEVAVASWQAALLRSPNDEAIANRLDFVSPATTGPWADDVPSEERLVEAVRARTELQQLAGADLAYLLDHEVTELRSDGSTTNVVTMVAHAFNQSGRDKLTRQRLQYGGRHRVLHAFSVDANGRRSEASVRSREVLYRGLDVGSTIVLQYRADAPPSGFLPRYLTRSWFFQSVNDQRTMSQLVLWYPSGSKLQETKLGNLERDEKKVGDEVRVSWTLRDAPPVVAEPMMPGLLESAAHVQLTTIPGWEAFAHWEKALMEGVFQDSPEVDALAKRLEEGATTTEEKLFRIHQFVMEEIRYQQDYETFIAGVKPHTASMVVERRYGDCKDKTVLFMTLAKKMGLDARFATVRTRDRGQVRKELPSQQFNHAIVYVPPQEGLPEGRFFDATADVLDLDVLRDDNAGTEAFVYDPQTRSHEWVKIPWQTPAHHQTASEISVRLAADGSAKGELRLNGRGRIGSLLRRITRNPENFKQFMQMVTGAHFTGASAADVAALEVKDLRKPASVATTFVAPNAARIDGEELRFRLPTEWSPKQAFGLAQRRHDLVLGTPNEQRWRFDVSLPEGMRAAKLPSSGEVSTECITLTRTITPKPDGLSVDQHLQIRCERIPKEQYPAYRTQMEQMSRFLDEELVVTKAKAPIVKPARADQKKR